MLPLHPVVLKLRPRFKDWVPPHWVTFFRQTFRNDFIEFLNAGVYGFLLLDGINPPYDMCICTECRFVFNKAVPHFHI
jgi:hypothetical protein